MDSVPDPDAIVGGLVAEGLCAARASDVHCHRGFDRAAHLATTPAARDTFLMNST